MHQHRRLPTGPVMFGRTLRRDPSGNSLPRFRVPAPWDEPSCVRRVLRATSGGAPYPGHSRGIGAWHLPPPRDVWIREQPRFRAGWQGAGKRPHSLSDDDDDDPRNRSGNATPVGIVCFRSPEQPGRIPEQSDRVREEPEILMGLGVGANRLASNLQTPPAPSS